MSWDRESRCGLGLVAAPRQMVLQFHAGQQLSWDLASTKPGEKEGKMSLSSISELLLPFKTGKNPAKAQKLAWHLHHPQLACPGHQGVNAYAVPASPHQLFSLHLTKSLHTHKISFTIHNSSVPTYSEGQYIQQDAFSTHKISFLKLTWFQLNWDSVYFSCLGNYWSSQF